MKHLISQPDRESLLLPYHFMEAGATMEVWPKVKEQEQVMFPLLVLTKEQKLVNALMQMSK